MSNKFAKIQEKLTVFAFKKAADGSEKTVRATVAEIHGQGYDDVPSYLEANELRVATRDEIEKYFLTDSERIAMGAREKAALNTAHYWQPTSRDELETAKPGQGAKAVRQPPESIKSWPKKELH